MWAKSASHDASEQRSVWSSCLCAYINRISPTITNKTMSVGKQQPCTCPAHSASEWLSGNWSWCDTEISHGLCMRSVVVDDRWPVCLRCSYPLLSRFHFLTASIWSQRDFGHMLVFHPDTVYTERKRTEEKPQWDSSLANVMWIDTANYTKKPGKSVCFFLAFSMDMVNKLP